MWIQHGSYSLRAWTLAIILLAMGQWQCTQARTVFFSLPSLTQDAWTFHNLELNTLLGALHYEVSTGSITPTEAGERFTGIIQDFLSSKQEFQAKGNGNSRYVEHASKTLKKAKSVKMLFVRRHSEPTQQTRTERLFGRLLKYIAI